MNRPRTGKAPLAEYLAAVAAETRREVATALDEGDGGEDGQGQGGSGDGGADNAVRGLAKALDAIAEAARRVAKRADMGDRGGAEASLEAVATRLEGASDRLAAARGSLPPGLALAAVNRFDQLERRTVQAKATDKLGKRSSRASD